MRKEFGLLLAALISTVALAACNTMEGVGKDVKKAGEAIERAADKKAK